jgi:hypothetical protein
MEQMTPRDRRDGSGYLSQYQYVLHDWNTKFLRLVPSHAGDGECEVHSATDAQPESRAALHSRLEGLEGSLLPHFSAIIADTRSKAGLFATGCAF